MHLNEVIMRLHAEGLTSVQIHNRLLDDLKIDARDRHGPLGSVRGSVTEDMVKYIIKRNGEGQMSADPMTLDEIYLKLANAKSLFYLEEASKLASEIQRHFPEYVDADAKHALSSALWMGSATTGVWPSVGAAIEFGCRLSKAAGIKNRELQLSVNPYGGLWAVPLTIIAGSFLGMVLMKHGTDECERLRRLPLLPEQEHPDRG